MQAQFTYDVEISVDARPGLASGNPGDAQLRTAGRRAPAGVIARSLALMDRFSGWAGGLLDRYSVMAKVRRLIRRHG